MRQTLSSRNNEGKNQITMGKVISSVSMSLDGFIAGPEDDVQHLFKWYFSGDTEFEVQGGRMVLKVSPESARLLEEAIRTTGAMVAGRRMFDIAGAWGGNPPFAPCFIVTHMVPQEWVKEGSPFTFVTDGVESAIQQAKAVAGDKNVAVATATITQQCLKAGLLDEINIDLVPVLLGDGIQLFDNLGPEPIELESIRVVEAPGVTHLHFRVVK
jgi:dihydrofolate reductase